MTAVPVNYSTMTTTDDPWLTGEEAAEVAGIAWSTWRAYVDRPTVDNPIPRRGPGVRVNPDTRRREWRRSVVEAWKAGRPGHGGRPPSAR